MKGIYTKYLLVALALLLSLYGAIAGADVLLPTVLLGTWLERPLYALHLGNPVIANLASSLFVSIVFWLLIVDWPEAKNRRIVRDRLKTAFNEFRDDLRHTLLGSCGPYSLETAEQIRGPKAFRSYFKTRVNESQERWHVALSKLQEGGLDLRRVYAGFDALSDEISYALHRVAPRSRDAHDGMRQFLLFVYQFKAAYVPGQPLDYDDTKWLGRELWSLMVTSDQPEDVDPNQLAIWIRDF